MQNTLELVSVYTTFWYHLKKDLMPQEIIGLVDKNFKISLERGDSATPRVGFIRSSLKGVYYVIHCDLL